MANSNKDTVAIDFGIERLETFAWTASRQKLDR
jgi:hypothetical protein